MRRNNLVSAALVLGFLAVSPYAQAQDATDSASSSALSQNASGQNASTAAATPEIIGKGVLVMDSALLNTRLKQHPASYTGALTTVTVPIGSKLRDNGLAALKASFTGGVSQAAAPEAGAYNITLRLDGFSYKYDSLSSFGMAVTPRVTITVTADVTGPSGIVILHKAYNRTDLTAGHYVLSLKPSEKVLARATSV
ncbi:hypothetical protein [Asticcacaulis sp. EMRT-3]|uniref:hypothetical protein n=1 Tax=Asticcacaulis sp. EMRT-3 TaxID=3040349 RepID=UPI0024AEA4A7|nr:hypothetical protein [Asticcacaulis sp. EMRT-3]MDI7774382.1 hypothetical protein [Asticcacaulis sp. EMRT-3]